jgi:hypothetical protein
MVAPAAVKRKRSFIFVIAISCTKGRTPFAPVNVAALAIRLLIQSKDGRHVWNESLVFGPNFSVLPKIRSLCWDPLKE